MNVPKKESKKGIKKRNKERQQRNKMKERTDKRKLLFEHMEPVPTAGTQRWKTGSLNNCTG